MITVPKLSHPNVYKLAKRLELSVRAMYLTVQPDENALPNECFDNVAGKINREGGERIIGWQLWQQPYMIEAEFHAVWRSPNGNIFDITPKNIPVTEILFIRDDTAVYEGRQLDNIRSNNSDNQLVDEYIALAETRFFLLNDGDKADMKMVTLTENEDDILKYISGMMVAIETMLAKSGGRNSACFCGSHLKYKHCHGKGLIAYLNTIKS